MPQAQVNNVRIEYEVLGPENAPAVLLIMGAGGPLTFWGDSFCEGLVSGGYRVIRFDNRDCGLSSQLDHLGTPSRLALVLRLLFHLKVSAPYSLEDMANDAIGLLDTIGVRAAHVVGVSMGGMIAQIVAARRPERVLSLTSIMSASHSRGVKPRPDVMKRFRQQPPRAGEVEKAIDFFTDTFVLSSSGSRFPADRTELRRMMAKSLRRSYTPNGSTRHFAAVLAAPNRRSLLQSVRVPTLVIHGSDDPVVPVDAGRETAKCIPGAQLKIIEGMGHGLPSTVDRIVLDALLTHFRTAASDREAMASV